MSRHDNVYSAYIARVGRDLKNRLHDGLKFINWREHVKRDSVVFVKPNLTFYRYVEGVTTSPDLLRHLLGILKDNCSKVIVGESDGGSHSFRADDAFEGHRMYEICRETGADLVNLSRLRSRYVESKIQGKKIRVQLPKLLLDEVDCSISVPVFKVHVVTGVTLGLKNLWGCYPDTMRGLYHRNLDRKLALIARLMNLRITVIDGLYALNGHGPMFGDPVKLDLILVANNVVVADTLGSKIMGIPLKRAKHIKVAEKAGLGTTDLEKVRINTDWNKYRKQFYMRKTLLDMFSILTFNNYTISKLLMDSPFSPLIYRVADVVRSPEEKEAAGRPSN